MNTPQTTASEFEFGALNEARNYRHALVGELGASLHGRVVEVGAGIGQMSELLQKIPAITFLQCVEPDAGFCRTFRNSLPVQPLLEGTAQDLTSNDWNGIITINVLEHIEDDCAELKYYHSLLKQEKGTLHLFVPARPEIYAPIDRDFGHYRRYTKQDITNKLTGAGFVVENIRYFNIVGYIAWWLIFCVLKKRSFNSTSVRLFDAFIFPLIHFFESRICPPPIGQSLVVIARAE